MQNDCKLREECHISMREYEIILSPDLDITLNDFAAAWNENPETRDLGPARVEKVTGVHYDLTIVTTILITVAGEAAGNVISALIMKIFGKHTHIEHLKKPDGSESFIVDIKEK